MRKEERRGNEWLLKDLCKQRGKGTHVSESRSRSLDNILYEFATEMNFQSLYLMPVFWNSGRNGKEKVWDMDWVLINPNMN